MPRVSAGCPLEPQHPPKAPPSTYLLSLVGFSHPAVRNDLHGVGFVAGEVCHLVASCEATLRGGEEVVGEADRQLSAPAGSSPRSPGSVTRCRLLRRPLRSEPRCSQAGIFFTPFS